MGETDGIRAISTTADIERMALRKFVWVCNLCTEYVDFTSREGLEDHAKEEHPLGSFLDYHVLSKDSNN